MNLLDGNVKQNLRDCERSIVKECISYPYLLAWLVLDGDIIVL